jgi:thioredoxin-related protein
MRIFALLLKSLLLFGLIHSTMVAGAASLEIPQAMDLKKQGQVAKRRHTPVMLVIISDSCPYCQKLEEEILRPLLLSGEYDDRIQLQVLNQDRPDYRVDFDGKKRSPDVIAARYEVQLVPTVLLLGPDGEELAERLIGINVVDFYWAYLELAIEEASSKLRESGS